MSKKEVVYRVRNTVAQRLEALKVLPESLQQDAEALERFFREIKVHARLLHPNIVTFHHAAQIDGMLIMTTELMEGSTLADLLASGPLPPRQSVSVMSQVLAALQHAHSQNVVHREVSPENIYILPDEEVKLGGFAMAKAKGEMNLTQAGTAIGPVHYISPEQVKGTASLDSRSDIYSAGCVLYEMLCGHRPFEATSQFDVMLAHIQREATPVATVNRNLPGFWSAVVGRAMAKKPEDRYRSAAAFSAALSEALHRPDGVMEAQSGAAPPLAPGPKQTVPAAGHALAQAAPANDQAFFWLTVAFVVIIILFAFTLFLK
ncbi:MAG: serine/threonine protein kinase [Bryobacterales bacterium]|nr:serine/threonine protein kinase [Bryobacterales bacterium]